MNDDMMQIYGRTMSNCKYYEEHEMMRSLLNEIGVLRGVAYCLESVGICSHNEDFLHFINIQNEMLQDEKNRENARIRHEQMMKGATA